MFNIKLVLINSILIVYYLSIDAKPIDEQLGDSSFNGTNWVVLCAGSSGWFGAGYSIQANVYHAYQFIRSNGIPDDHIIVIHTDDIAYNSYNPTPGQIIHSPNGTDVYHGVPKDYTGDDVNGYTLLGVLRGDPSLTRRGKKVINSGPNDHIFVFYVSHGVGDIILLPEYIYGEELVTTLKDMHQNKRYAKLVFYLEACFSGSMFLNKLPTNINVYAVTAANSVEEGLECYYDEQRKIWLAGCFAYHWLHNSEHSDITKLSFDDQYKYIYHQTITQINITDGKVEQHPQQFGDLSIAKLPVSQFFGSKKSMATDNLNEQIVNDYNN
ncbi:legumain-like [Oppia nitens]|uniref:legumain-like n=1 Tax=Oppia nitens TaxID=1686743 RepID=UPI0023D9C598|nr:legumain-like [Oppia nitens]